jgi:hypothetical protein
VIWRAVRRDHEQECATHDACKDGRQRPLYDERELGDIHESERNDGHGDQGREGRLRGQGVHKRERRKSAERRREWATAWCKRAPLAALIRATRMTSGPKERALGRQGASMGACYASSDVNEDPSGAYAGHEQCVVASAPRPRKSGGGVGVDRRHRRRRVS